MDFINDMSREAVDGGILLLFVEWLQRSNRPWEALDTIIVKATVSMRVNFSYPKPLQSVVEITLIPGLTGGLESGLSTR